MTASDPVTETARAKINLALHVTGQRPDGYHLLDSMVMFAELGDVVTVRAANSLSLTVTGPFADQLTADSDNLVLRAAALFGKAPGAAITLQKMLPVASGIGGGSADAAATLRALSRLWKVPLPGLEEALSLGADVPVCLSPELTRMGGVGERIDRLGPAPMLDLLLVNPGVALSTPQVFGGLSEKANPPLSSDMPDPFDTDDWINWLARQRNDLERPAITVCPEIAPVLAALRSQTGVRLARMSGSGATCFAIFEDGTTAEMAQTALRQRHPDWWVCRTMEAPI